MARAYYIQLNYFGTYYLHQDLCDYCQSDLLIIFLILMKRRNLQEY